MSEVLERVAKAIWRVETSGLDILPANSSWRDYVEHAEAAIAAQHTEAKPVGDVWHPYPETKPTYYEDVLVFTNDWKDQPHGKMHVTRLRDTDVGDCWHGLYARVTYWRELPDKPPALTSQDGGASLDKCPNCGGLADNGHDRCLPPNPYYCTKCQASQDGGANAD